MKRFTAKILLLSSVASGAIFANEAVVLDDRLTQSFLQNSSTKSERNLVDDYYYTSTQNALLDCYYKSHNDEPIDPAKLKNSDTKQARQSQDYTYFVVEADNISIQNGKRIFSGSIRIRSKSENTPDILQFNNSEDKSGHDMMVEDMDNGDVVLRPYDLPGNSGALYAANIKRQDRGAATGVESVMLTRKRDFGLYPNKAVQNMTLWNPSLSPILEGVSGLLPGIIAYTTFGFDFKTKFVRPIILGVEANKITVLEGAMIGVNLSAIYGPNFPVIGVPVDKSSIVLAQNPNDSKGRVDLTFTKLLGLGLEQAVNFSKKKPVEGNFLTAFFTSKVNENKAKMNQFLDGVNKTGQPSAEQSAALGDAVDEKTAGTKFDAMGSLITFLKESEIWIDPVQRDVGMRAAIDLTSIRLAKVGVMAGFRFYNNLLFGANIDTPVINNIGVDASNISPEIFKLTAEPMVRLTQAATSGSIGIGLGLTDISWQANNLAPIFVAGNWANFNTSMSLGVAVADSYDIGYNFYKAFGFHLVRMNAGVAFDARQYAQLTLNGGLEIINTKFGGGMLEVQFARPYVRTEVYADLGRFVGVIGAVTGTLGASFEASPPISPQTAAIYNALGLTMLADDYISSSGWAKVNVQVPSYIPVVGGMNLGGATVDLTGTFRKGNVNTLVATAALNKPWWLFFIPAVTLNMNILPAPVAFDIKTRSLAEGVGNEALTVSLGGTTTSTFTLGGKGRAALNSYEHPEDTEYVAVEVYGATSYPKINVTAPDGTLYEFDKISFAAGGAKPANLDINATTAFFAYDAANKATIFSTKNAKKGSYKIELVNAAEAGESRVVTSKPNPRADASFENLEKTVKAGESIKVAKKTDVSFDMNLTKDATVSFFIAKVNEVSAEDEMGYEEKFDNFVQDGETADIQNQGDFEYQDDSQSASASTDTPTIDDSSQFGTEGAPSLSTVEMPQQGGSTSTQSSTTTSSSGDSSQSSGSQTSTDTSSGSSSDASVDSDSTHTEASLRKARQVEWVGHGKLVPAKSTRAPKFRTFRSSDATTIDMNKEPGEQARYSDPQDLINYDNAKLLLGVKAKAGLKSYTVTVDASKLENGEYRIFAKIKDDAHAPAYRILNAPIEVDYDAAPNAPASVTTENVDKGLKVKWTMDAIAARSKKRAETTIDESVKLNPGFRIYAYIDGKKKPAYVMEYTPDNIASKSQEYVIAGLDSTVKYKIGVAAFDDLGLESDITFAPDAVKRVRNKRSLDSDGTPEIRVVQARTEAKVENGDVSVGFTVFNNGTADVTSAKVKMYYGVIRDNTKFAEFNLTGILKKGYKDIKLKVPANFIAKVNASSYIKGAEPTIYYVFDSVEPKMIKAALNSGSISITNAELLPRNFSMAPSAGWNLMANPTTSPLSEFSVFGDYTSLWVYGSDGAWKKAAKTGNINEIGSIPKQTGFWLNTKSVNPVSISGVPSKIDFSALKTGWNLIGGGTILNNISTNCPQCRSTFVFRNGAYEKDPTYIGAGEGFWANIK